MTDRTTSADVRAEIIRRITGGIWGPGTLLPGEVALATEFGCSRTTMNRALREISDLGLIDRRRKAGTRVRMAPLRRAQFEMPLVRAEIEATGAVYGYRLLARSDGFAPDWLRRRFDLSARARVTHVHCLHLANGTAYQFEDRWINAAALPQVADVDFAATGPNEWLVGTVPYSEVEISFCALPAEGAVAEYLGHAPGAPVFTIERATWWHAAAITFVTLSHVPGHRMTTRY